MPASLIAKKLEELQWETHVLPWRPMAPLGTKVPLAMAQYLLLVNVPKRSVQRSAHHRPPGC